MRRYRLWLYVALAFGGLVYSGSMASADVCAIGFPVHHHASIWLHGKKLAKCGADGVGCKCVSCYAWNGGVYSTCYPLY
jgi:hypothetical protein